MLMNTLLMVILSSQCIWARKSEPSLSVEDTVGLFRGSDKYDFAVEVPAAGMECFWHFAHQSGSFYFTYMVQWVTGMANNHRLFVTVNSPEGVLVASHNEAVGQLNFQTELTGFYRMCLGNHNNQFGGIRVFVSFGVIYERSEQSKRDLEERHRVLNSTLTGIELIMDKLELLTSIFSVCKTIYGMVGNMKTNKERCQRLVQRVKALEEMVLPIKQRGPGHMSSAVVKTLNDLWITLISTKELIMKYSQTKAFMSFVKSKSHEEQFYKMNESLTYNLQILSGVLQVEHGNMLCRVYDSVLGMRQNEELPLTSPTALMPLTMPTAPMPLTLPLANPKPFMHLPMPVLHPTTPTHNFAGSRPVLNTAATMPKQCIMPCMQYSPRNPMSFSGTMASTPLSTTVILRRGPTRMSTFNVFPTTAPMAPMPIIRPLSITTVSHQNTSNVTCFVKSY